MNNILWATDTHLDCLPYARASYEFGFSLAKENPEADALFLTGDISDGDYVADHLEQLAQGFNKPIYFVLGNHDYYHSSFAEMDKKIVSLCKKQKNLFWLNDNHHMIGNIPIVGSNGWYDAVFGNSNSEVSLYDFSLIKELAQSRYNHNTFLKCLKDRSKYHANQLKKQLSLVKDKDCIIVLTHIPPYHDAAWHKGVTSDSDWLPWFTSYHFGNVLDQFSSNHPNTKLTVLCGHSHSPGIVTKGNIKVYTGLATYGHPSICGSLSFSNRMINAYDQDCKLITNKL